MNVKNRLVHDLWVQMQMAGLASHQWTAEWRFAEGRQWRFDLAYVEKKLAIEVQGATYAGGRHSRGASQIFEYEKLNAAAALGWRVLYFDARMIQQPKPFTKPARTSTEARRRELYGCAIEHIRRALG